MTIKPEDFITYLDRINTSPNGARTVVNTETIDQFLSESVHKDIELRFICYYIKLGIVNIDSYPTELYQKVCEYQEYLSDLLGENCDKPLESTPLESAKTIAADVPRCYNFFEAVCDAFGVKKPDVEYGHLACTRMLCIITLKYPELEYIQGFDRYMIVCFAMALKIVQSMQFVYRLENSEYFYVYAEGLSLNLIVELLKLSKIHLILANPHEQQCFQMLDTQIKCISKDLDQAFKDNNVSSMFFATAWRLLLFTHVHEINDVMLLWDRFLLHTEDGKFEDYFVALALAHIRLALESFTEEDYANNAMEKIQRFENYDFKRIIVLSDKYFRYPPRLSDQTLQDDIKQSFTNFTTLPNLAFDLFKATTKAVGRVIINTINSATKRPPTVARPAIVINPNDIHSPQDFAEEILYLIQDLYI